jgi:uncharacterized membrane protein YphA (DoxX/SURF4 family)
MKIMSAALYALLVGIVGIFFLTPFPALAHVKWFAESVGTARAYQITDIPVLIWIVVSLALLSVGFRLDKKLRTPAWFAAHISSVAPTILSLASVGFGAAFLIFSFNGFVFAPNLPAVGTTGTSLLALQAIAGAMILLGIYERLGGALILVLFGLGIREYGAFEMLDTLEMVGMALYAMIIGRPRWSILESEWLKRMFHKARAYGVPLLRVGTGLNLMVLGFTEKILAPELTHAFLSTHSWNFMQHIGFKFYSDYWFAFSAGITEVLIGLFFVLGFITRITTVFLALFLLTTLSLLGPIELIGHLPHFSIALVLLVMGSGARLTLVKSD